MNLQIMFLVLIVLGFSACSQGPTEDLTQPALVEDIAALVSQNLCQRVSECRPELKKDEKFCETQTTQSLTALLTGTKIEFTQGDLKDCVESIKKSTCEQIMNPDGPPEGCSKLQ